MQRSSSPKIRPQLCINDPIRLPPASDRILTPGIRFLLCGVETTILPGERAVNHLVSNRIKNIFCCGGLVYLAADSTHGTDLNANGGKGRFGNIYAPVRDFFRAEFKKANGRRISPDLYLKNLDELDPKSIIDKKRIFPNGKPYEPFRDIIVNDLDFPIQQIGARWKPLNPNKPERYILEMPKKRLPSFAFVGLGAGPKGAHVAYFGEDGNIFETTTRIKLGEEEAQRRNVTHAFSMGADSLLKIDHITVTVKESRKMASLIAAFEDAQQPGPPKTGLGWLIRHRSEHINIVADIEAARALIESPLIMRRPEFRAATRHLSKDY